VFIFRERTILLFTAKASAGAGGGAGQAGQDAQRAQEVHVLRHFEASQGRPWAFVSRGWERKKGRPQAPDTHGVAMSHNAARRGHRGPCQAEPPRPTKSLGAGRHHFYNHIRSSTWEVLDIYYNYYVATVLAVGKRGSTFPLASNAGSTSGQVRNPKFFERSAEEQASVVCENVSCCILRKFSGNRWVKYAN